VNKKLLSLVLILVLFSFAGCQKAAEKPALPEKKPEPVNNNELSAAERRTMAFKLAKTARDVDGVQSATVIISSIGMTNNLPSEVNDARDPDNNMNDSSDFTNEPRNNNESNNTANNQENTSNLNNSSVDYSGIVVIIGLDLNSSVKNNNANIIKKTVMNLIKASDERISQVIVISDSSIVKRFNNIASAIINGEPINNFENEVKDLNRQLKEQKPTF
jgi:hypothetical protein